MKVWKSPVFYFGIALVLVVVAALLAPFVIDWGSYRADLEAYGKKLTGRKVAIAGPIAVRLFPFPKITAADVRIANPDGFSDQWLAQVDQVTVQMTLGALINGSIQVESIDVQRPVVKLQRTADGRGNWNFSPSETIRNSPLLEHVMLDKISLHDGALQLVDDRRNTAVDLVRINGIFSAPNPAGPWRTTGGFTYDEIPLAFVASTGEWKATSPLTVGLRITSQENTGYSYFLDGLIDAAKFTGNIRLEHVAEVGGKGDSEGRIRPVKFKAKAQADFDRVDLSEIEIRPADQKDQGTLLAGKASLTLGKKIEVKSDLTAPRVDLDALAGAGARRLLRDGGGLSLVNGMLTMLPQNVSVRSSLKIAAMRAGGETLENLLLDASANREAIRIHELSADLPGRTRSLFSGVFFPGEHYAELGGNLALESQDTRQLATWLWSDSKADILKTWSGSRGHLKAKSDVTLTASKLEFPNIEYEIDSDPGKAGFKMLVNGERPIVDLKIDTPRADVDKLLSRGFAAQSPSGEATWLGLIGGFVEEQSKRDLRLTVKTGNLILNGVEAHDVALDMETTVRGFDLKALDVGSVDGAKLNASGVVLNTPDGPDGDIGISVDAEDPRGLLRLAGIIPRGADPAWATSLGKTGLKIALKAKPAAVDPATSINITGSVGDLTVAADGSMVPAVKLENSAVNGSVEIHSVSSAAIANLYGWGIAEKDNIAAKLVLTIDGNFKDNFIADLTTDIFRSRFHYAGKVSSWLPAYGLNGDLTLEATDAKDLLLAARIPAPVPLWGPLTLGSRLASSETGIALDEIEGKFGAAALGGHVALAADKKVSGELTIDRVSLGSMLAAVFLPWDGEVATLDQTFAKTLPFGLTGELWVRPKAMTVYSGLDVAGAQIGLTAADDDMRFAMYAKTPAGDKISVDLASKATVGTRKISGQVSMPFDMAQQFKLSNGNAVASGKTSFTLGFEGHGLSPAGVLASLNATGGYSVTDGRLLKLSPENFTRLISAAKDSDGLTAAFAALHDGQGISLGSVFGSFNVVNGVATLSPFGVTSADADIQLKPVIDLASSTVDLNVTLKLKALPNLPQMQIAYAGPPAQLQMTEDAGDLSSFLGFKVLAKGVDDLEKLQAEQQRLALEEEKLRLQDQEKLDAFYAQKAELRLRMRELRVQADQRALEAKQAEAEQVRLIEQGIGINRLELRQRLRELKMYRKVEYRPPLPRIPIRVPPKVKEQAVLPEKSFGPVLLVPLGSSR